MSSLDPYYGVRKPGSIGLPVRGQQMKIVAPDGTAVKDGELGEIVVKGPNVMAGYLHNQEATGKINKQPLSEEFGRSARPASSHS